jgi:acetylornithine deacetylase
MINTAVTLLQRLIQIESISKNEARLVTWFADWLTSQFPQGAVNINDRNITVTLTGKDFREDMPSSQTMLACSHYDTVPVCAGWTKDPFGGVIENDAIYGLGANDALASVVSMTCGALAARNTIEASRHRVVLSFVCEEESGGAGFARMEPHLPRYTAALFGETTSLRIGYCMRGSLKLKLRVHGKACHASRPHEGKNAIFELSDALNKIRAIELTDQSPWGTATLEPVVIQGGTAENQIPDLIEVLFDSRPTWERNNEYIIASLQNTGLDIEVIRNLRRPMAIETTHPLIHLVQQALQSKGSATSLYPFGGSCDMAFSKAPSIVFGPGASERSHAADEYITSSELDAGLQSYGAIFSSFAALGI